MYNRYSSILCEEKVECPHRIILVGSLSYLSSTSLSDQLVVQVDIDSVVIIQSSFHGISNF
jgi:hypothetical protein